MHVSQDNCSTSSSSNTICLKHQPHRTRCAARQGGEERGSSTLPLRGCVKEGSGASVGPQIALHLMPCASLASVSL